MAIKKPVTIQSYYVSDFVFKDDSLVTEAYLKSIVSMTGGTGIVVVKRTMEGKWVGKRNIILTL